MDLTTVTYSSGEGIARIVLNRPAQLNAISPELLADLDRACAAIEADPAVRAATLTAAGRAFCAGADLRAVRETVGDPERWSAFMSRWHRVFDRIEAGVERYRRRLPGLSEADLRCAGRHPSRGVLTVPELLERFVVSHLEEHASQLAASLAGAAEGPVDREVK